MTKSTGLKEKTKIVVNRVGLDAGQIGLKKAQETIGRDIFWQIPNDYRTMVEVRNNGVPLLEQFPKASITQAVVTLAATLTGEDSDTQAAEKSTGSGWLSFWSNRQSCAQGRLTTRRDADHASRRHRFRRAVPYDRCDRGLFSATPHHTTPHHATPRDTTLGRLTSTGPRSSLSANSAASDHGFGHRDGVRVSGGRMRPFVVRPLGTAGC